MALGSGPWGSTPFGSGLLPTLQVLRVDAIRENVLRITFDRTVYYTGVLNPQDASSLSHYLVQADANSRDSVGLPPREVTPIRIEKPVFGDSFFLDVVMDREFSSFPAVYLITLAGLRGKDGLPLQPDARFDFFAVYRNIVPRQPQFAFANRDFANPQVESALLGLPAANTNQNALLGTYRPDGIGDLARDEGEIGYKKRIFRRLTTRKGGFAHMPNYGVGIPDSIKQLASPGFRERLAADSEQQIKLEPETSSVSVMVQQSADNPGLFFYKVFAKMKLGQTVDLQFTIPGGVNANV
jgi:hypothetical protein